MPEDTAREAWIAETTAHLHEHLEDLGYTEEECRELAAVLFELPDRTAVGTQDRHEQIMYRLLRMQGLDEPSAMVVARAIPHVDWSKLLIGSRTTWELLDASAPLLLKYRRSGTFEPAIEHRHAKTGAIQTVAYWLSDVLMTIGMDRLTERGSGQRRFWWRS